MSNDLVTLKAALADNAEALLVELFGEPTLRTSREWRWGKKYSSSYRFDRATFYSFEAIAGGSLLDAVMLANASSFPEAIKWAKSWLGIEGERPRPAPRPRPTYDVDTEQQRGKDQAALLWRAGRGINGTAAARYLQGRAIDGWPADSVRLIGARDVAHIAWRWWRWPALMFPLTNDAGTVTAVQLIALTDQGEAAPHWEHGGKIKMVRGVARGSALRLPGDASGPLILAEGGETALSIWLATGYETWAVFGAIGRASLDGVPLSRAIVVGRDDDKRTAPARKALREAVARWRRAGRHVVEAQPWSLSRGDKSDFNDVLNLHGPDAVRDRIDAALRPQATTQGAARKDALLALSTAVGRTVSYLLAWRGDDGKAPPFKVIRATLGLGKSQAALEAIVDAIGAGHRIVYSAPTHDLAAELAARAEAIASKRGRAVTVRVWHGRERAKAPRRRGGPSGTPFRRIASGCCGSLRRLLIWARCASRLLATQPVGLSSAMSRRPRRSTPRVSTIPICTTRVLPWRLSTSSRPTSPIRSPRRPRSRFGWPRWRGRYSPMPWRRMSTKPRVPTAIGYQTGLRHDYEKCSWAIDFHRKAATSTLTARLPRRRAYLASAMEDKT